MTGVELYTYFLERVQQNYTGYLSTAEANRLFKQSLYEAIEQKYRTLAEQRVFDELTGVVKTEQQFTPVANQLTTITGGIVSDYNHLLAIKCKFTVDLYVDLIGATNATPIVITTEQRSNLRTGDNIEITNVIGNTNANGVFYIRKISDFKFQLYSDINLQTPVAGNAAYISGGDVSRVYYKYAKLYRSDEKIGLLAEPTVDFPKYETVQNVIKIYPASQTCQQVTMDYITKGVVLPDVADAVVDLENTYPFKFLMFLVTVAAEIFSGEVKDKEQAQTQEIDLSQQR